MLLCEALFGDKVVELLAGSHVHYIESQCGRSIDIGLRVVEKQGFLGQYAQFAHDTRKYLGIRLMHFSSNEVTVPSK